jgi:hypothetical protein
MQKECRLFTGLTVTSDESEIGAAILTLTVYSLQQYLQDKTETI